MRILRPLLFLLVIIAAGLCAFGFFWYKFANAPFVPNKQNLDYIFAPGSNIKSLASDLHTAGLLPQPKLLIALAYWQGVTKKLQAGEYYFPAGTTPVQLLNAIANGRTNYQHFTIIEGWSFQQLLAALNQNTAITHTLTGLTLPEIQSRIGMPPGNPEGLFLPATYKFTHGTTDVVLLQKAHRAMLNELNIAWTQRAPDLPYKNSYEALIAASIIEKEVKITRQQVLVAGVIVQRLEKNMPLQMDSTVLYAAKLTGDVAGKQAYQLNSPYNTYKYAGLPPTPIAMPGVTAIQAALHPLLGQALYFVETGLSDGSLRFSANLMQHNEAVQAYEVNRHYHFIMQRKTNCEFRWYLSATLQRLLQCG